MADRLCAHEVDLLRRVQPGKGGFPNGLLTLRTTIWVLPFRLTGTGNASPRDHSVLSHVLSHAVSHVLSNLRFHVLPHALPMRITEYMEFGENVVHAFRMNFNKFCFHIKIGR